MPELKCQGWLSGPPPHFTDAPGDEAPRLIVVDVWARWCPFSAATAPHLAKIRQKHRGDGVSFVSLTTEGEAGAASFASEHSMDWAHGYGAGLATIEALGALDQSVPTPGYEVKPTLYLAGSDGKVLWCDSHARLRHMDPEELAAQLDAEIERHCRSSESQPPTVETQSE